MPDAVAPGWTELGPCGPRAPAAQQRPVRFTQDALEKVSQFYGGCFWVLRGGGRRTIQTSSNITTTPFSSSSPVVDLAWLARGAFFEKKMSYFPDSFSSLYIFFWYFPFFLGGGAPSQAELLWTRTKHYKKDGEGAQQALVEVLQLDPRSVHQGRGKSTGEGKPFNLRSVNR